MNLEQKKIVVTGGSGFLGSWVVEELASRGVDEENIVVPRSKDYDLTEKAAVEQLYANAEPDVVIHLAATVGGIGANSEAPGLFFYNNIVMGLELIEQARQREIEKFVTIGTVCSYPKFTPVPFQEEELWNGYPEETNAPYGIAKKALLVQGHAYRQQYGLNSIYLIPVNLYGPRDNFDPRSSHVIPALIKKVLDAKDAGEDSIVCWGDGSPTREFLYVKDAARGIVDATATFDGPEPINLGTGEEISILELAELIVELTGFEGSLEWDTSKPNGQPRRCLDTSRAERLLGFEAGMHFREGLQRTIEWYEARRRQTVAV